METYRRYAEAAYRQHKDEEAFEIEDEKDFQTLDETIRGEMPPGLWKQITLTFNPWINSHWTKTRFFDNEDPEAFTLTTTYRCNEWLDEGDRKLIERLEKEDPERYLVVGLGEYGIPGGAYFGEFRRSIHVIEPIEIPEHWRRYVVIDYGLDMLAAYWIAVDTHNKAYCYKELFEGKDNGMGEGGMGHRVSDAAQRILEVNGDDKIYRFVAPPDLWNRHRETGKSTADIFWEHGIRLFKASNNRVQGWYGLKEWLKPYEDEQGCTTASLVFFKNCVNIIRTLPQLQCDEKDPNDVAKEPHDITHGADALRCFCDANPKPMPVKSTNKRFVHDATNPRKFYTEVEEAANYLTGKASQDYLDFIGGAKC